MRATMKNLSNLKPSSQDPIPAAVLRDLPLGSILLIDGGDNPCYRLDSFSRTGSPRFCWWRGNGWSERLFSWTPDLSHKIIYPRLPAMVFPETCWRQVVSGEKDVMRRRRAPKWCEIGELFCGWDRSFRKAGKGKARGLGVFQVVSVEMQHRFKAHPLSSYDVLTLDELRREGFPDLSGDQFWQMLKSLGGVDDSGRTTRIEFRRL